LEIADKIKNIAVQGKPEIVKKTTSGKQNMLNNEKVIGYVNIHRSDELKHKLTVVYLLRLSTYKYM